MSQSHPGALYVATMILKFAVAEDDEGSLQVRCGNDPGDGDSVPSTEMINGCGI